MSQSAKGGSPQEVLASARRGRPGAAGDEAFGHASLGLARAGFSDPTLVLRWPAIAGAEVARIAVPVKLQEGAGGAVLTLKCEPGAAVFLQHQTRFLIETLNAYLGAGRVARIRLVTGNLAGPKEPAPHPMRTKFVPRDAKEKIALPEALRRLGNLRASLRK